MPNNSYIKFIISIFRRIFPQTRYIFCTSGVFHFLFRLDCFIKCRFKILERLFDAWQIVLNLFFGPAINAARGVASQVSNAVMGFISNFQVALNPQITKDYATGNITGMERLSYLGIKYSFLILFNFVSLLFQLLKEKIFI